MHKILIVDDHEVIGEAVIKLLQHEFAVVVANTSVQMRQCLQEASFSAVVMDIDLRSDDSGIDLLPEIKAASIPIIVYSGTWDKISLRACMVIGIRAFVDKAKSSTFLLAAVRKVIAGEESFPDGIENTLFNDDNDRLPHLSPGEQKLLERITLLPEHPNVALAESLHISVGTLKNRLSKLYGKFQVPSKHELIEEARRRGYRPLPRIAAPQR